MHGLIKNVNVYIDAWQQYHRWIAWDGRTVEDIGIGQPYRPDADFDLVLDLSAQPRLTIIPGMIDIHIHGSAGHDVMDATPTALHEMSRFFAQYGVTAWLPTTLTHTHQHLMAALLNIKAYMQHQPTDGAQVIGARLEGPYLNRAKAGAQNPQYIREPHPDEFLQYLDLDVIKIVDVAPEIPGADALIAECARRGIITSVAHSNATADQVLRAHTLGLSHSTHTFNAQSPLHQREPGVVGAVLTTDTLSAEVLGDGVHVHPMVIKLLFNVKRNPIVITDAVRPAGMPDGVYPFDDREVILRDGAVRLPDGTLAGSSSTMNRVMRVVSKVDLDSATPDTNEAFWHRAVDYATINPARLLGIHAHKGHLDARGGIQSDADFVIVDEDYNVYLTVIDGHVVYNRL